MAESRLDPDAVPDAEPDVEDADSDACSTTEHPADDRLQLSDDIVQKMKVWLPPELKEKHADLLIVFAEDDRPDAVKLQNVANALEFELESGIRIQARALLQNEAVAFVTSHVDWLGYALKYSTLICFLFTDNFISDPLLKEMAKASFWETVNNLKKQHCFIPVYLQDLPTHALSPYFAQLIPLRMYHDGWEDRLRDKIWHCLASRLEREKDQRVRQTEHILQLDEPIPTLQRPPGLGPSAPSDVNIGYHTDQSASSGCKCEPNLDVHFNDGHLTNADACRREPDGSYYTDAASAAGPASASAASLDVTSGTDDIEFIDLLLAVAIVAIPVFAFFNNTLMKYF